MRLRSLSLLVPIFCVVVTTSACSANTPIPTSQVVPQSSAPGAYNANGSYFEAEPSSMNIAPAFNPPKFYRTGSQKAFSNNVTFLVL